MDVVRIDCADLDDLLHLGDADLPRHRAGRVEVARGLAEQQVAGLVGLPCLDQRYVGDKRGFQHVMPPVDLACLLALCDYGAVAGGGEERGNPRAAGAQALGKRALGIELKLKLASQELALELLVLAHVGRNHLPDLARAQQLAEAEAVDAGVRSEEHTSELQSLMRISYAVFCLKK